MPRKPRNIPPGSDVHTVFRTINKQFLFLEQNDHLLFLDSLKRQKDRYGAPIFAWTGMSNHHHVFNQTPVRWHQETPYAREQAYLGLPIPASAMLRDTQSYFVRTFNRKKNRDGDVIKDRTKTIRVCDQTHALSLLIYIFLNPVRAGIVKDPIDYPFSNYEQYTFGRDKFMGLFDLHPSYLALDSNPEKCQEKFRTLVKQAYHDWAHQRWEGASASHWKGRGIGPKKLARFISLAEKWVLEKK